MYVDVHQATIRFGTPLSLPYLSLNNNQEEFEDTKGPIRNRISKKNRQHMHVCSYIYKHCNPVHLKFSPQCVHRRNATRRLVYFFIFTNWMVCFTSSGKYFMHIQDKNNFINTCKIFIILGGFVLFWGVWGAGCWFFYLFICRMKPECLNNKK